MSVALAINGSENAGVSDIIRLRLQASGLPYLANSNIAGAIEPGDLERLTSEVEANVDNLLRALVIDVDHDHNTAGTAHRVAKMLVNEVYGGRYKARPSVTSFPNVMKIDQCDVVGPITVRSCCAHHLVPILGQCWIGTIPDPDSVIGLSKHHRLADWIMSRPQIQEEAVEQLADEIERAIGKPRGLAVVMRAKHLCCGWRGVRDGESLMTTSVMRGFFKEDPKARQEFMTLIGGMGFN